MKVCVVGCGAVGSLFAAALAQLDDVEVWAYDLDAAHVRAINEHGLRITGAGELVGRVRATSDARDLPACDFGIVAVKSMHTDAAVADTAHAFADGGAVCSVQNGAGNEELIAKHVREVIRGTTFPAGHVVEPGHVAWDTRGDTHIGPFEPSPAPLDKVRVLADACTRGGMPTHALEDARGAQWRKLIFNAASNAIGALTGLTHGRIAEQPTRDLAWAVMAEGRAVADAQGIVLDQSPEELFDFAARREIAYDHKPSMLQDIQADRPTEIDFLNGAIVAFGEGHDVDTPLNRALTALVKGLERSHE
jgi:2-dehydropantoate 2-reductase